MNDKVRCTIDMNRNMHKALKLQAMIEDVTISSVINRLVYDYITNQTKEKSDVSSKNV